MLILLGVLVLPACSKDTPKIAEGERQADEIVCSCAADYAKAKSRAYNFSINHFAQLEKRFVKAEYSRLKAKVLEERIEASRCIRNWALEQESYWYEDQLVGPDFQGLIKLNNPQSCRELILIQNLDLP